MKKKTCSNSWGPHFEELTTTFLSHSPYFLCFNFYVARKKAQKFH